MDLYSGKIVYTLTRRKMKNIRIRVTGDGRVAVSAPRYVSASRVEAFIREHEPFIRRRLAEVEKMRSAHYPPRYADGDPNAGKKPRIGGLTYMPAPVVAANHLMSLRTAQFSAGGPCEQLMVAMDTELSQMISSCDPDNGDFTTLGPIPGISSLACVEIDYEGPGGGIWAVGQRINDGFNSIGTVNPETGTIDWKVRIPDNWLIQQITFKPKDDGIGNMVAPYRPHFSVASGTAPDTDEPGVDPVALCRGEG
jgi:hypothetical protein